MTFNDNGTDDTEARAFAFEHSIEFEPGDTVEGLKREVVEGKLVVVGDKIVDAIGRGHWSTVAALCGEARRVSLELAATAL